MQFNRKTVQASIAQIVQVLPQYRRVKAPDA